MRTNNSPQEQITDLLADWSNGDQAALDKLMPLVYDELRRLARHYMRNERAGQTLQTTALVHEAYLKLADYKAIKWHERAHFFAVAAQVMRRVLVEHARARNRVKRGGNAQTISLDAETISFATASSTLGDHFLDMLALDEAMRRLEAFDSRKTKVVEMRFFAGMENEEIAAVLDISVNTVMRDWNFAEGWLRRELVA
jgi:RNA polymerase sigma factor (TIGR02999 family)